MRHHRTTASTSDFTRSRARPRDAFDSVRFRSIPFDPFDPFESTRSDAARVPVDGDLSLDTIPHRRVSTRDVNDFTRTRLHAHRFRIDTDAERFPRRRFRRGSKAFS